ncbi:MAG: beta-ketoacyl-ACP synthase III [Pseudomonadota bacterium]
MTVLRAVPIGCGHYLPERVVENAEFEKTLETTDEWITARTGIKRRRFAAEGELTSDLAINAANAALSDAGITGADLDAIVLATATPDQTFPSTATRVQAALGMQGGFAFDVQAVCAGFIFALSNANALIVSCQAKRVMVIGAETFSRIMDWNDRSTCVLFGDGAGALILEAREQPGESTDAGILTTDLNSDGRYNDLLYVDGGVSSTQSTGVLRMQGQEVFKHAVSKLHSSGQTVMQNAGVTADDVDVVVPHQANLRIIRKVGQKMAIPEERIVVTVQDHGNTSAASIPLAMSVARQEGRIGTKDLILMEAIGGGLAWGAALMRWN